VPKINSQGVVSYEADVRHPAASVPPKPAAPVDETDGQAQPEPDAVPAVEAPASSPEPEPAPAVAPKAPPRRSAPPKTGDG
jgi:hypothetical protein